MKKIISKKVTTALLRGAVVVSGATCTFVGMLFCTNWYALFVIAALGASIITVIYNEL